MKSYKLIGYTKYKSIINRLKSFSKLIIVEAFSPHLIQFNRLKESTVNSNNSTFLTTNDII